MSTTSWSSARAPSGECCKVYKGHVPPTTDFGNPIPRLQVLHNTQSTAKCSGPQLFCAYGHFWEFMSGRHQPIQFFFASSKCWLCCCHPHPCRKLSLLKQKRGPAISKTVLPLPLCRLARPCFLRLHLLSIFILMPTLFIITSFR